MSRRRARIVLVIVHTGMLVPVRGSSPAKAGTKYTPPAAADFCSKRFNIRHTFLIIPCCREATETTAPAIKMLPQGINCLSIDLPGDSGKKLLFDSIGLVPIFHHHEASRSVGIFNHSRIDTHLAKSCRLLVTAILLQLQMRKTDLLFHHILHSTISLQEVYLQVYPSSSGDHHPM